jgi:hypothetical protein
MKTTILKHKPLRRRSITTLALNLGMFAGLGALPLQAQDDGNTSTGHTEDEWYDPGNWSDNDNSDRAGSDWWGNQDWSDSSDYQSEPTSYDEDRTVGAATPYYYYYWEPIVIGWTTDTDSNAKRSQQQNRKDHRQQTGRDQDHSMKTVSFDGKVEGFKKVNLKSREGQRDDYSFVRVRLKNGDARVVSLGSRVDLSDLDLEKGDTIKVTGRNARIDDRDVLVASRIKVGEETFRIRKGNRPEAKQMVSIEGTVKQFSKTSFDDAKEDNLLIRLELKDGKGCVVDLGEGTKLKDLDIEKGSKIRLKGEKTRIDGKSLIVARKISVDGDTTRVREKSQRDESARRDYGGSREYSANQREDRYDTVEPVSSD